MQWTSHWASRLTYAVSTSTLRKRMTGCGGSSRCYGVASDTLRMRYDMRSQRRRRHSSDVGEKSFKLQDSVRISLATFPLNVALAYQKLMALSGESVQIAGVDGTRPSAITVATMTNKQAREAYESRIEALKFDIGCLMGGKGAAQRNKKFDREPQKSHRGLRKRKRRHPVRRADIRSICQGLT